MGMKMKKAIDDIAKQCYVNGVLDQEKFAIQIIQKCIDIAEANLELEKWAIVSMEIQDHFDLSLDYSFMVGAPNGDL
jgi:hypothetical protein